MSGNMIAFLVAVFLTAGCAAHYGPPSRAEVARVNGMPQGPVVVYDGWGHVETRGTFQNGLKEGIWTYYVSTGHKVVEVSYRNGLKDGLCRMWYGPFIEQGRYVGNLKLELTFQKGQPTGTRRRWYPSGEKDTEVEFENGRIVRARVWEKSGEELPPSKAMSEAEDEWRADLKYLAVLDTEVEEGLRNSGGPPSKP